MKFKIVIIVLFSLSLNAQSVEEFVAMANNNNVKLQAIDNEYASAKLVADQVDAWPDLNVGLALGVLPVETRLGPQRVKLGVSQMIPWPGLLSAKREVASAMAEVKSTARSEAMIDITLSIRQSYYQLQALRKKQELLEENRNILEAFKSVAQGRVEAGNARLSDILRIENKIQEVNGKISLLQEDEISPTIAINRLSYRPLDTLVETESSFDLMEDITANENFYKSSHPTLRKLEQTKIAAEKAMALTDYQSKPKIGVGLDYVMVGQRNDVNTLDGNGRDIIMPMGSIAIPLNTRQYEAKKEEEKLRIMAIDQYQQDLSLGYQSEIRAAQSQLAKAKISYAIYQELLETNATTLELLMTAYAADEVKIDELLQLYSDQINYQIEQVDAILQSNLATAIILKYNNDN